jgi:hypothetical protein
MFKAPVPCSNTVAATVPLKGLRARTIGSCAGLAATTREGVRELLVTLSRAESARVALKVDSTAVNACATGKASNLRPSGLIRASMMMRGVISDEHDLKIFKAVVVASFVAVVDVFVCSQRSSKMRRHDDTMLKLVLIADSNRDVSISAHKASRVLARSSAVHLAEARSAASCSAELDPELVTAVFAGERDAIRLPRRHRFTSIVPGSAAAGFCAHTTISHAGFSAVPQPSHRAASGVAGAVMLPAASYSSAPFSRASSEPIGTPLDAPAGLA